MTEEDFDSAAHIEIFRQIIDSQIENDITTISEQVLGDNDQLSTNVAHHSGSDVLVVLSDIMATMIRIPMSIMTL